MSLLKYQEYHEDQIKKTRDIINLINHTENIGIESQKMLDEQYEKLQRCDNLTENINTNLETSSNILGRIKYLFFSRKACNIEKISKNIEDTNIEDKNIEDKNIEDKNISHIQIKSDIVNKNISNNLDNLDKNIKNELNNNLDEINYGINNLKNIALSINKQLDLDAKLLDKINIKSEINNNNIKKINKEINKLL